MKAMDLSNVQAAGDFERLSPGGYVCRITGVQDNPEKDYLLIEYDIAEGPMKGYYESLNKACGFWGGKFIRSTKESALGFFKRFIDCVENSNAGYHWNWKEETLVGKGIGLALGEEEYIGNDGSLKTRLYVAQMYTVNEIRTNKYKVPTLKKLAEQGTQRPAKETQLTPTDGDDLPF